MNELAQIIEEFEQEVSQLTKAIEEKLAAERKCQELEALLLAAMDFLVMLDDETLTEVQETERQALLAKASQLLTSYEQ